MLALYVLLDLYGSKTAELTQDGRNECDAVGDHRALHDVQLRQDDEDEEGETDGMHRLEDPDDDEVREGASPGRLEDANPSGTKQTSELGHGEGEQDAPDPRHLENGRV